MCVLKTEKELIWGRGGVWEQGGEGRETDQYEMYEKRIKVKKNKMMFNCISHTLTYYEI